VEVHRNGQITRYTYDGLGHRRKVESGSSARNLYHDSLGRLLFETDASNRITMCYVYGGATLVARANPNQESHFYHFDKTGNTLALSGTNGRVSVAYAYSPFGAVVKTSGPADDNPFTYVGQYGVMDEGEGLFFMQNRHYDAHTGRFLRKDPIGFAGGINLYAYVGNNPVNHIDPSGLFGWGYVYQALRRFSGQTKEMAELAGKMADTMTGAGLTMAGAELIPAPIRNSKVGYALDYLQLSGGRAAVYLSKHLVEVAVTTSTNVAGAAILGGLLAAAGGIEIGHALHSSYERFRGGRALGTDIADLGWDFYEYMFTGPGRSRRLFPPLSPESSEQPVAVDCAGPYLGYQ
jgi:RHS repeat-associated protein